MSRALQLSTVERDMEETTGVFMPRHLCASFLRTLWDVISVDGKARLGSYPMDMCPG